MASSKPQRTPQEVEDIIIRKIFLVSINDSNSATSNDSRIVYMELTAAEILSKGKDLVLSIFDGTSKLPVHLIPSSLGNIIINVDNSCLEGGKFGFGDLLIYLTGTWIIGIASATGYGEILLARLVAWELGSEALCESDSAKAFGWETY
ncbi:hypothetical protein RIF29_20551 [Crotalaria pallida]|uniref:Uncharacterized protein n=1 Tax=Crotalaria pallida TaxID=3830 RepID=A0AAN9F4R0_CROPI